MRRARPKHDDASEIDQGGATPDVHQVPAGEILAAASSKPACSRRWSSTPILESALRAADGITVEAHRQEIAELWSRFGDVARTNPEAAFPVAMSAGALLEFGPDHRPLAFPYGKWHASQWTVDQAAALLFCSMEAAERFGVVSMYLSARRRP